MLYYSYRALAKETDGDFAKFVLTTRKPRDMAQKWRGFKNIARFYKNPFAYVYWKMEPFHSANRVRIMWVLMFYHLYQSFMLYVAVKTKKEGMIEHWRHRIGETNRSHTSGHRDRRFPVDRKKNYVRYSNFHQQLRNKRLSMIWTNWWCRDQNFRKYFEMRKKHGIKPSLSGFYHESIHKEANEKNMELHRIRMSRSSV